MQMSPQTAQRLGTPQAHFINGARVESGALREVLNPATGESISQMCLGGAKEIDAAVAAARAALPGWSAVAPDDRAQRILKFAELMERHGQMIGELSILDGGLTSMTGTSTAPFSSLFLRYYAGWTNKITGQTMPSSAMGKSPQDLLAYTLREPIGVVGAITPWNYPFGMEMLKIAPVLATGCTLVLKPAEDAPVAGLLMAELAHEAGIPEGVFNVVNGLGEEAGAALAAHDDVDKVAFTGSTEVGRIIVKAAAGNLKKVSLELGGKSPVFVFADADLATTVPGVAMAGFLMSGQNCVCGSRLFVHEKIADDLAAGIAEFARNLPIGPGADPANAIGPLISERQCQRVEGMIARAEGEGAKRVTGGQRVDRAGWFIEPTLFADCRPDMEIARDEVFGPVIAMQTFSDSEDFEALAARGNDTSYGLSGSVWTRDLETAMRMSRLIDSGQVGVNCHAAMDPTMPFGGNKQSGWGREFGDAALDMYTKTKAVTVAWS
ncbi:aldehyde dehydrogenase family protein [Candidatus Foliamicus sp.]